MKSETGQDSAEVTVTGDTQTARYDLNGDGSVNLLDITYAQLFYQRIPAPRTGQKLPDAIWTETERLTSKI